MRQIGMKRLSSTLAAVPVLAASVLLAGCGSSSGSTAAGTTAPASAGGTWTGTSDHPGSPAPSAPSAAPSSPAVTSATAPASSSPREPMVPPTATSAEVSYLGPKLAKPVRVSKHVTGMPYEKLATALDALKPVPAGTAQCMVLTGENATVTITADGHTWVFTVEGSPCRPVSVAKDGATVASLAHSSTLLAQIRGLVGAPGMAHPLTG